jgi:hypothetical protein
VAIPAAGLARPPPRAAKDPVLLRVVLTAKKKDPVAPPAREERAREDRDPRLAGSKKARVPRDQVAREDRDLRLADTKKHPPNLPPAMDTKC